MLHLTVNMNIEGTAAELEPNKFDLLIHSLSLILKLFLNDSQSVNEPVGHQTELFTVFIPEGTLILQSIEIQAHMYTHKDTHAHTHTHTHPYSQTLNQSPYILHCIR